MLTLLTGNLCPDNKATQNQSLFPPFLQFSQEIESNMNVSLQKKLPIYAYPVVLGNEDQQEIFVTLEEPNIFTEPYDSIWIKLAGLLVYLVGLSGSCILYSFVMYEATGRAASFRTLINQLVSYSYFSVSNLFASTAIIFDQIVFQLAVFQSVGGGLDLLRALYGPLPFPICWFTWQLKSILFIAFPIILDGIVIFKFLFIAVWKGIRQVEDDLLSRCIVSTAFLIGIVIQMAKNLGPGRPVTNIIICTGVYKPSYDSMEKPFLLEAPFALVSFLICALLVPIIQKKKYEQNKIDVEKRLETNHHVPDFENFALYFIIIIFYILGLIDLQLMNMSEPSRLNEYPNYLFPFYAHFIAPLQVAIVPAFIILKKMKISVFKEMLYEVFE